jgi:hypothetical protein
MQTDITFSSNKLEIIVRENEKGTFMLIDIAISGETKLKKEEV